ncbi:MAG: PAS domain S-box protein [Acidimicrobiia bacterium]
MFQASSETDAMRSIFDSIADAIVVIDTHGTIHIANQAAGRMFGYTNNELIGANVQILMCDADRAPHAAGLARQQSELAHAVEGMRAELTGRRKDGSEFPLRLSVNETTVNGTRCFTGVLYDRSEEQAELQVLSRFANLLEASDDFIGIAHNDGRVLFVNPAGIRMVGLPANIEYSSLHVADFSPPEVMRQISTVALPHATRHGTWRGETSLLHADGTRIAIDQAIMAHFDESGDVAYFSTIGRDISQRNEIQRLHDLERTKDEFISTVSHELRTPLTAIYGSLGLLANEVVAPLPPEALELVNMARFSTQRLVALVSDILDLEKMQSGSLELRIDEVSPDQVIRDAVRDVMPLAVERGVTISVRNDLPPSSQLRGDAARLVQVVVNLLANAVKFSPVGQSVEVAVMPGRSDTVTFSVTDHGRGIASSALPHLFEPFFQVDASSTRAAGGTGLGLSICQAIVEQHGGSCSVESELGLGSTFRVTIPLAGPSTESASRFAPMFSSTS